MKKRRQQPEHIGRVLGNKEHKDQEQNAEPLEEGQYDKYDEVVADMLILNAPGTWIQ